MNYISCQPVAILFQYAKEQNISMKDTFQELLDYIEDSSNGLQWNAMDLALSFSEQKDSINNTSLFSINYIIDEDLKYLNILVRFYTILMEKPNLFAWGTKNIGSFFIKTLLGQFKSDVWQSQYCKQFHGDFERHLDGLHKLFTLPGHNVSLPDIAYLYSMIDFKELSKKYSANFAKGHLSRMNLALPFRNCIDNVANQLINFEENSYYNQHLKAEEYLDIFPCLNQTKYPLCNGYCTWHKELFNHISKEEFLTIMKFALPQRSIVLSPNFPTELTLAEKLFGADKIKSPESKTSPMTLAAFCHRKYYGFTGKDIGISAKVCDDFFPTPTDAGICLTKNFNIQEIIYPNSQFNILYESEFQKSTDKFEHGTYWSETTLVIFADSFNPLSQNYKRAPSVKIGEIQLQLHQSNEFAHMLMDSNYDQLTTALKLEANNEYYIDISPTGQVSTQGFRDIDHAQRKCHLKNEVLQSSIFKVYTQANCNYECYVKQAKELCKCIPWDFLHNEQSDECDIFGRTCFINTMENLAKSPNNSCEYCLKECDYIKYNRIILDGKTKSLTNGMFSSYITNVKMKKCFGSVAFCDFIIDNNNTFKDYGLKNALEAMKHLDKPGDILTKFKDLIIVHMRFLKPEIDVIDSKYTVTDKFANVGGLYGIYGEITGCSFLALLHLLILSIRYIFCARNAKTQSF